MHTTRHGHCRLLAPGAVILLLLADPVAAATGTQPVLQLEEAMDVALANHPAIPAAHGAWTASKTMAGQVAAWDDPVLSLATGIPFESPADPPLLEVKVEQKFPLSGIYKNKKDAAQAGAGAAGTQVPTASLDVALQVATAYYAVVFLEEEREVVERQIDLAASVVEAATLRFSSLAGNQADVIRARIAHDEMQSALEVIELDLRAARQVLVLLMGDGRDPDGFEVAPPPYPAVHRDAQELASLAVSLRPELAYYDAKAQEYAAGKKEAKSSYAPFLSVSAGYQYKSDTLPGLMGEDVFALGFAVNLPFQVKKRKSAVDEAEALAVANEAQKQAAVIAITERIVETRYAVAVLEEKIALHEEKVIPQAGLALELTLSAYAVQKASITDVLASFDKLLVAERKRSVLRGKYFHAVAMLQRQVGSFEEPL